LIPIVIIPYANRAAAIGSMTTSALIGAPDSNGGLTRSEINPIGK
jgi:hypothetical protein